MLALGVITAPVHAQSFGPAYTTPAQLQTYRASIVGLAPAASATDFFTIGGVAGHQVRVHWIKCNGISTAAATAIVQVSKRSTLDTAGTSTSPTTVRLNALNPVASAVVKAYTANPTLGTLIGVIDADELTTNTVATSAFANKGVFFDFTNQYLVLDSATAMLALNANAASLTSGASLNCTIEWDEV